MSRSSQRGSALVLALVVLTGLGLIAVLALYTTRTGVATAAADYDHTRATYAAESGAAAAMDFLRDELDPTDGWSKLVTPNNATLHKPAFPSNGALPGTANNPFAADQNAWFEVELLNNRNDPGFATGHDADAQIIIRVTGHSGAAVSILEWEIHGETGKPFTLVGWRTL